MMPKMLVVGRGGSGKSTLVVLLARRLGEKGRVLVVDADESNLGLGVMLGIETPAKTLMDYLGGKPALREMLTARGIEITGVLPYSPAIAQTNLLGEPLKGGVMREEVDKLVSGLKL